MTRRGTTERKLHHLLMNLKALSVGSDTLHVEALPRYRPSWCVWMLTGLALAVAARLLTWLTLLCILPRLLVLLSRLSTACVLIHLIFHLMSSDALHSLLGS